MSEANTDVDEQRRDLLEGLGGLSSGALLGSLLSADAIPRALATEQRSIQWWDDLWGEADTREPLDVFPQAVSSGDPTPSGMIVWTRIEPDEYDPSIPLALEVAESEEFSSIVKSYEVDTEPIPDRDHTVKVDLDGDLEPMTEYAYRFVYDGIESPTGFCRTLPAKNASLDSLDFAVANCQNYRFGYYGAHHHMAQEDADYLLWLGDIIYENSGLTQYPDRTVFLPSGAKRAMDLRDFRFLYKKYFRDQHLQETMKQFTMMATWDDHEIINNRYYNYEEDRPYTEEGNHPYNDDGEQMTQLFFDGIRAWWEYMPVRVDYDPDADHLLDLLRVYRTFEFGDLATVVVTDERLFRSQRDGDPDLDLDYDGETHPGDVDLDHFMLGQEQREWFVDEVVESDAKWKIWVNEVMNVPLRIEYEDLDLYQRRDAWDGYQAERKLVMEYLKAQDVENFICLTGDLHACLAGELQSEYSQDGKDDDPAGVEIMIPPVTSRTLEELHPIPDSLGVRQAIQATVYELNPHIDFFDHFSHGYGLLSLTDQQLTCSVKGVDKKVKPPATPIWELENFRVQDGEPSVSRDGWWIDLFGWT